MVDLSLPELYINRELSWLAFNERVLEEAQDPTKPLYERLMFSGIVSSNLDEFFMVRVAGLQRQVANNVVDAPADGLLPAEQLEAIGKRTHPMVEEQYRVWREELVPLLAEQGLVILPADALDAAQRKSARKTFVEKILPALTPLAVDNAHPFPHLRNKSINVALILRRKQRGTTKMANPRELSLALVQVPSVLPRLIQLPSRMGRAYMLLEELIAAHAAELFPGFIVKEAAPFRVTRNWDLAIDDEDSEDLLITIEDELRRRDRGSAVRVELAWDASRTLETTLCEALKVTAQDVYRINGPIHMPDMNALSKNDMRPIHRFEPLVPAMPRVFKTGAPIHEILRDRDVFLHHPYESFEPVVRFIEEAADDPNTLAIKMTLYRTSGNSPFVRALTRAAENGKQVAVLVELKARFDEENNIQWARHLEEAGVHVVYGLVGLKTHSKVALVVRREGSGIERFIHLGTGNYNPNTAKLYTDCSLFTSRPEIAEDVSALFNMLTGLSDPPKWRRLAVAPMDMADRVIAAIDREAEKAKAGKPSRVIAKMNSLVAPKVIQALYRASQAGVPIDLVVRGICCLRPGVPGVSENIRVRSVVGRFLEHSRVFVFGDEDEAEVFLSSADWMPRNLYRRVEVMFPVEDPAIKRRILDEVLGTGILDNTKARELNAEGVYTFAKRKKGAKAVNSQSMLIESAKKRRGSGASLGEARGQPDEAEQLVTLIKQQRGKKPKARRR